MLRSLVAATVRAFRIWAEVIGLFAWIIQPWRLFSLARCSRCKALSVITVFGADVPVGSWLSSRMTGCAMHPPGVAGVRVARTGAPAPTARAGADQLAPALPAASVGQLHARAREPGA